ncbi:hypothetical protein VNI00_014952 [Paramarasmius palmivorus]|uniref:Ysc84 actin-binding domain-containing protein n=1 Tax=Paramarasmius palmivorus TaxID=297713 RepID=A0AAW0BNB6_9AGAR
MSERLAAGDASLLAELHATTTAQDLETARRSMGGHGFSAFSGVGQLYAEFVPAATYEGDNFVLDQQVVRAAVKSFTNLFKDNATSSEALPPSSAYLGRLRALIPATNNTANELPVLTESSWTDPEILVALLEWRAALLVHEIAQTIDTPDATIFQRVSKASTEAFVAANVADMINRLDMAELGLTEKDVLRKVYLLYLLTTIEANLTDFLSFGLLRFPPHESSSKPRSRDPTRGLRLAIATLCEEILPNAIGLTDAFGFTDWELDSALGVYNGGVYEALWEKVQALLAYSHITSSTMPSDLLDKFRKGAQKAAIQATAFTQTQSTKLASSSREFVHGFSLPGEAEKAAKILDSFLESKRLVSSSCWLGLLRANSPKGLAVFQVIKAGFVFSGKAGSGLVIARLPDGSWSAPSCIATGGLGWGLQIGADITDFVIVLNSEDAVRAFSIGGNVTIGGNISAAAGPIGTGGSVQASLAHPAPMFSYSKSKGLFAGLSLEGTVLIERKDANRDFYGSPVPAKDILGGRVPPPEVASRLYEIIEAAEGLDESGLPEAAYVPTDTGDPIQLGDGRSNHMVFDADHH